MVLLPKAHDSDAFFEERNLGNLNISFDNVTFVLNAVDAFMGDEFIEPRSRRPKHRTLVRVEATNESFTKKQTKLNSMQTRPQKKSWKPVKTIARACHGDRGRRRS